MGIDVRGDKPPDAPDQPTADKAAAAADLKDAVCRAGLGLGSGEEQEGILGRRVDLFGIEVCN
jgi:hypothetical protein